jgi:pheromone shutdown protein TraB
MIILNNTAVLIIISALSVSGLLQSPLSKSTVRFAHPKYRTEVILIGCLHGSSSSASDVRHVLNDGSKTDVVALELCPTRYKDLKKDMERRKRSSNGTDAEPGSTDGGFLRMVSKTTQAKGIPTGIAALVLGGSSIISTKLSGFEAGAEFVAAIEYVESRKDADCDVILADMMVDETLKGVGNIPKISIDMLKSYISSGFDWGSVYEKNASVLSTAIGGSTTEGLQQIKLSESLLRNRQVITDILRLLVPNYFLIEVVNAAFSFGDWAAVAKTTSVNELSTSLDLNDWNTMLSNSILELSTSTLLLILGYILFVLPATSVILTERDIQLSKGIDDACRIASIKDESGGKVVGVFGFLHVNGVAKILMTHQSN